MNKSSYSTEPVPGSRQYKLSAMLQHYLGMLISHAPAEIETILQKVDYYSNQFAQLKQQNINPAGAGHKALDDLYEMIPAENKNQVSCTKGCTGCCYIDLHITVDEAAHIIDYCREQGISIDKDYLNLQAQTGRKEFSAHSKCVFLEEGLCSIYPARPAACRKHFVKSDPKLCDSSLNTSAPVDTFFDLHSEIVASAMMNVAETDAIEKMLLLVLNRSSN